MKKTWKRDDLKLREDVEECMANSNPDVLPIIGHPSTLNEMVGLLGEIVALDSELIGGVLDDMKHEELVEYVTFRLGRSAAVARRLLGEYQDEIDEAHQRRRSRRQEQS